MLRHYMVGALLPFNSSNNKMVMMELIKNKETIPVWMFVS